MEIASFKRADLNEVEHTGGWFAHVWPQVSKQTAASGHLLIQPSEGPEARHRIDRVSAWAADAGLDILVAESAAEIREWADKLAV
jgi:hypothetical protein